MKLYRALKGETERNNLVKNDKLETGYDTFLSGNGKRKLADGSIIGETATKDKFFFTSLDDIILFLQGSEYMEPYNENNFPPIIEIQCDDEIAEQKMTAAYYIFVGTTYKDKLNTNLTEVILPAAYVNKIIADKQYKMVDPAIIKQYKFSEIFEKRKREQLSRQTDDEIAL